MVMSLGNEIPVLDAEYGLVWAENGHLFSSRKPDGHGRIKLLHSIGKQKRHKTQKICLSELIFVLFVSSEGFAKQCE